MAEPHNHVLEALRPFLNPWGWYHPDQVLAALASLPQHPHLPGIIITPTHLTIMQAGMLLGLTQDQTADLVHDGHLDPQWWFGDPMILVDDLTRFMRQQHPPHKGVER